MLVMTQPTHTGDADCADLKLLDSISSCATALDLSDSGVRRLMASGALPSVQIGSRRLVPHEALVAYVERLKADAATTPRGAA